MEKCPFCLAEVQSEANFCLNCGNRLVPATISPLSQQATPDRTKQSARFILHSDPGETIQTYYLDKPEISIGRAPNSDILLTKDKLTSRRHATVHYENGNYYLRDESSVNGTFVNGRRLEALMSLLLHDKDLVGIGEYELIFRTFASLNTPIEDMPTVLVPFDSYGADKTLRTIPDDAEQADEFLQNPAPIVSSSPPTRFVPPAVSNSLDMPLSRSIHRDELERSMEWSANSAAVQPEEPSKPEITTRYSDISFPEYIIVSQEAALRVAITRKALNELAVSLELELPEDKAQQMEVDTCVVVSPSDFNVKGPNVRTIVVPLDADSSPTIFKLTAKSVGKKTVGVEFFQNSRYLGRAEALTTAIDEVQAVRTITAPVAKQIALEVANTISPPDLTILFDRVPVGNDKHYYRYRLLSPLRELNLWFDEFRSPETNVLPQGILEDTFKQLNNLITNTNPDSFFFARLNSIGMSLYRRLFPDDFKRFYWNKLRNHVKNIVIISFEPWIPWELVRPFNIDTNEAEDGFLCEKFNLTRWLAGAGFPDTLSLEQLGLIMSASSLDAAKLESEEIRRILGTKVRDISSSSEAIYQLLRTSEFSGLHFACHGAFNRDSPDMSTLKLEDGTWISPIDIDGDGLTFGKNKPLVFLNACETGRSGYALTGMGGWAEAFIGRAKCSGFIGSTWKANDESACKFAVEFYRNLLDGKTIAEAARRARFAIKQAGDPTWLSYTIYANPLARLSVAMSRGQDEINSEKRHKLFSNIYENIYQHYGYANEDRDEILDIVRYVQHEVNKGEQARVKKIERLLDYLAEIAPHILSLVVECLVNPDVGIASDVRTMMEKFVTHM